MLIIVIAVVLAAEAGARVLEPHLPVNTGSEQRALVKARQMRERGHTQIAIVGSSEAAAGIDPETLRDEVPAFGSAYNAGLVGSHLSATDRWFRRVVGPRLEPDVVLIGILPLAILSYDDVGHDATSADDAEERLRETKRAYLETSRVYESTIDRIAPAFFGSWGPRFQDHSALVRTRSRLRSPSAVADAVRSLLGGGPDDRDLGVDSEIGPSGRNLEYDGEGADERAAGEAELYRAAMQQPLDLDTLGTLVSSIRSTGAEPLLALAPIDRLSLEADGLDLDAWDVRVEELRDWAEANGVPLDDRFSTVYPRADFHDRHHLRRSGAIRWSRELGRWIDGLCRTGRLNSC